MSNIVILKPKFEGQAAVVKVVLGYVNTLDKVITWLGISVKKEKLHNTLEANIFQDPLLSSTKFPLLFTSDVDSPQQVISKAVKFSKSHE